ncbi:MAG TPA: hypothetical protein DIC34_09335 [Treponema sp.]|nr:MAG: hypothetical protein A2Y36_05280 [Treponema sp. GWA1_62_8]OHE64435.1 MAG: hypothetical protein A2001_02110 [Treponema sp. GWC1_61_84]OHE76330.1 MAG: hypothetical protein A2413_16265 [Treponema sp. RIFOXYC1_FULL_61_9]HCM26730.1 hypothetical protein [Treponema sp.]
MNRTPAALEVTLRKINPLAPPFHRHIATTKLLGQEVAVGDTIVVYEVTATVPEGRVAVDAGTRLRFE